MSKIGDEFNRSLTEAGKVNWGSPASDFWLKRGQVLALAFIGEQIVAGAKIVAASIDNLADETRRAGR